MRKFLSMLGFIFTSAIIMVSPGNAFADNTILATDLGTLGGATSTAIVVNEAGQVAGNSDTASGAVHGFIWQDGVMTDLGTLGGSESRVIDMNNHGQVVGESTTAAGDQHGFIWDNGVMTDLGTLGGSTTDVSDINDAGQVVGYSTYTSLYYQFHAFIWQDGVMTDLTPTGIWQSEAHAINESGQVVGYRNDNITYLACIWENGTMTDIGALPGDPVSDAWDINDSGTVIGMSSSAANMTTYAHAFVWENGTMTPIVPLAGDKTWARIINNAGMVAGESSTATSYYDRYIWQDGVMTDIAMLDGGWSTHFGLSEQGQVAFTLNRINIPGATIWKDGVITYPPTLGGNTSGINSINNNGLVAGYSNLYYAGPIHATLWELLPYQVVSIDAIPYDDTNSIDMARAKTVPVAILGAPYFDAGTVDPATVLLNNAPIKQKKTGAYMYTYEDVNTDGRADMVCEIDASQLSLPLGISTVTLTATTTSGQNIQGTDSINRTR